MQRLMIYFQRPAMNRNEIQMLKMEADLVSLIAESGVELAQRGAKWWGLCPFHNERTPSFMVAPDSGYWKCWGCGAIGDVIEWLRQRFGYTFKEAIECLQKLEQKTLACHSANRSQDVNKNAVLDVYSVQLKLDKNIFKLNRELAFSIGIVMHNNYKNFLGGEVSPAKFYTLDHYYETVLYSLDLEANELLHRIQAEKIGSNKSRKEKNVKY